MVRFGVPGQNIDPLSYADSRLATVPVIQAPRRPTVTDKKFPIWCEWRVNKDATVGEEGEFWKLVRFESNGDATWVMFGGGAPGTILFVETDDGAPDVEPDGFGEIQIFGGPGISVTGQGPGKTITVSLTGGGTAVDQIDVDFNTAPGTDPVDPDANGLMSVFGNTVTNATNTNAPVATHSRALNQYHIDVQLGTAVAPTPADPYDVGLISVSSAEMAVDGNGFMTLKDPWGNTPGAYGLGITLSGGLFSITKDDASALSATNRGYLVIGSESTPGTMVRFNVTANSSFEDANGTSDIIGNLFGLTTGIATDKDIPFWIYAVMADNETDFTFMISRSPWAATSPSAANIGKPSSAVANTNFAFWAFDDSITVGDYDTNPAIPIGSFRMRMDASDDWTVQTLANSASTGADGIGYAYMAWDTIWQMPTSQFGAATGRLMTNNGGTTPQWTEQQIKYSFDGWNQLCTVWYRFSGDGGTDGAGAVSTQMIIPFSARGFDGSPTSLYTGSWLGSGSGLAATTGIHDIPNTGNITIFKTAAGVTLTNAVFGNGAREIRGTFTYRLGS